jgi:cytochrome c oxidase subunit 3
VSGTTVTWAHHCLIHGDRGPEKGPVADHRLGLLFSSLQAFEYIHAPFAFGKNTYGSAFYMATGFHGFHVIVGTIFLAVCLKRAYNGDFTPAPALRLRGSGVVLALRRRGVAVPLRLHLCLGQLGLPG